jgi:predicted DNA-binding transcriptional regulator YafY
MAGTNQTTRVLELIKRFNNGQKVCIEQLQNDPCWWSEKKQEFMSEKSIRRDLDVIKAIFPESFERIRGAKGCYKAITTEVFNNFMKPEVLSLMVQTFNMASRNDMFDKFDLDDSDKDIIKEQIKELDNIYEFKNKPFENAKSDTKLFKSLESAIKYRKYITISYPNNGTIEDIEVKPYKILFINENFYLACEVEHERYEFSNYRISKIQSVQDSSKRFYPNRDIENFIKDIQTPFATYKRDYKKHLIEVKLEVDSKKAFFFKSKDYLKSQKIIDELPNGNIIISYKVTQVLEVEELIKRWMPYIKVIQPLSLKQKLEDEMREYLGI